MNKLLTRKKLLGNFLLMLFFIILSSAMEVRAQDLTVTGTVTSAEDGMPIPGVTVLKKGTTAGVLTDFDGIYTIQAKTGDVLQFRYLGMEEKDVVVSKSTINLEMTSSIEDLDKVVVIGYGTVKKKEVTGAVSSLKSEDIEQVVTSDLGTALQGQMAGVNVIASSGQPGAESEILIRGITTVSGSNTPLYIVDGLIQDGDPGISPNEIQSIDVLKDAASTAIYGTRGAAGVILITTKQGEKGSLSVRANSSYGIQHLSGTPTRLMNANQQTYFELVQNRNSSSLGLQDDEIDIIGLSPNKLQLDTNLFKRIVIDNQPTQNHSVNISGGTKDITYSVTTGLYKTEGTLVNSNFERFNIRANTTYKHDKWDIRASVSIANENTNYAPGGLTTQIIKYSPLRQDLTTIAPDEVIVSEGGLDGVITGWVLESFENESTKDVVKNQTNLNLNYNWTKKLKLSLRYGISTINEYRHTFNPYREVIDVFDNDLSPNASSGVSNASLRRYNRSLDLFATYKFNIKNDHNFTLTGGATFEDYIAEQYRASRLGVLDNSIKVLNGTSISPEVSSGRDTRHKIQGVIGRLQYGYKGRYLLSSSIRRDASSRFSEEYRSNLFPSTAFAWNVSDENFWKPFKRTVNNAKFRVSYGEVGNESFGDYAFDASITPNIDYVFGSDSFTNGAIQTAFANEAIKWETSIQTNFGLDLGFFKNKFTLSAEYYDKTNKDMLFPIVTPGSAGGGGNAQVILNVGNMTNKGLELTAGYKTNIGKLRLKMNGTFTTNKNKVTRINGLGGFAYTNDSGLIQGARGASQVTTLAEGYEAGAFFLYPTDGVVNTQEELIEYQKIDPSARLGDLKYVDTDLSGNITDADRVYSGSGLPEYEIGYNINASYRGFDVSMNWYAALGHEIMNGSKATAFGFGRHEDLVYQWSEANPTSNIPAYRGQVNNHANYKGYTDLWLEDGDYLRLKQVTLGYSFSKKVTESLGFSKLRLYASAQNPLTFTNYSGFNPEVGGRITSRGLDKGNYPITSLYLVGLNLNF
ncbi:SusC/RagA family TonB-linked outer membrane protein [Wenyingzhuangia fucanilytica]|nr:TonB-dependent receptor [Wenyingzhuangia fucanilytica]